MRKLSIGLLAMLFCINANATDLSPNTIGGGDIPGNYAAIDFYMKNRDWAPTLTLSNDAADQSTVAIHTTASMKSNLIAGNTDYPLSSLTLNTGDEVSFVYQASKQQWSMNAPSLSPNSNGGSGAIPAYTSGKLLRFDLANGNWAQAVTLPASAPDCSVIAIASTATWTSRINAQNVMFAGTFNIRTGDQYVFVYRASLQRWVSVKTPELALNAAAVGAQMAAPVVPYTKVNFSNGNWVPEISLPATAGDRDRISLSSDATWTANISNQNLEAAGSLKLYTGARYDFIFIKEKNRWVLQSSPETAYTANSLGGSQLPDMKSPSARYTAADGNWTASLRLPVNASPGDRLVVKSDASWDFSVSGENTAFGTVPVRKGETLRFVRNAAGAWALDTRIITMLLIYSEEAAAQLGEVAAQMRLHEGLRLTNEALENSKVNFYIKTVGLLKRQFQAETLGDILNVVLKDSVVASMRTQSAADAVYYEGTEDGCGLAGVNASKEHMLGSGSLNCGITVMRHEFGHNMGLNHGDDSTGGSAPYAKGYSLIGDIMGGNGIAYYSNPNLYTSDYNVAMGLPMGIADVTDSARALNERSLEVSQYY